MRKAIAGIDGVVGARVDRSGRGADAPDPGRPRQGAAAAGSSRATCAAPPTTLLSGIHAGSLFEEQKVFEIVVWGAPEIRTQPDERSQPADRHARRRSRVASATSRTSASRPVPGRDRARGGLEVRRRRRERRRAASRRRGRRRRRARALRAQSFPLEYHAEVLAERERSPSAGCSRSRSPPRSACSCCCRPSSAAGDWRRSCFLASRSPLAGGLLAALLNGGGSRSARTSALFAVLGHRGPEQRRPARSLPAASSSEDGEPFGPALVLRGAGERVAPDRRDRADDAAIVRHRADRSAAGRASSCSSRSRPCSLGGLVTSTRARRLLIMPVLYLRFGSSRQPGAGAGSPAAAGALAAPGAGSQRGDGASRTRGPATRRTQEPTA